MTEPAFEGRDFLRTAMMLAEGAEDEGAHRSAISRAYYACFHRVRTLADDRSAPIRRDGSAHVEIRRFIATIVPPIEWELNRLHKLRKHADYDIPFPTPNLAFTARAAVTLATNIIDAIDALESEAPEDDAPESDDVPAPQEE